MNRFIVDLVLDAVVVALFTGTVILWTTIIGGLVHG